MLLLLLLLLLKDVCRIWCHLGCHAWWGLSLQSNGCKVGRRGSRLNCDRRRGGRDHDARRLTWLSMLLLLLLHPHQVRSLLSSEPRRRAQHAEGGREERVAQPGGSVCGGESRESRLADHGRGRGSSS